MLSEQEPEDQHSEAEQVLIGCPKCLRSFPQVLDTNGSFLETVCSHCCTAINYAVVEQLAPVM